MPLSTSADVLAGRYRLGSRIAAGGMGEVWRGMDLVLDRPVAVKLLRAEYAQHAETLARFKAEARHAAALSHPAIARVYDYGEEGDERAPFLVMELVNGPSLTQVLASGPLGPARVLDVVAQVAAGLAAAHAAGVMHRDIKPGNLLVDPDGRVKITDFGIASAAGSAPLTRTGTVLGTPAYLAPERLAGASAGPASDLYALGMVAYQCLAGALPFTGTAVEVALAHHDRPLPPLPPAVPRQVAALVENLTAKDPAARPGSACGVAARAAALRTVVDAAPIGPAAPTPPWPDWPANHAGAGAALGGVPPRLTGISRPAETAYVDQAGSRGPRLPPSGTGLSRGRLSRLLEPAAAAIAAIAAIAVIGGFGGFGGRLAATSGQAAARSPAARSHVSKAADRTVSVNAAALIGRPVGVAVHQLQRLGLRVRVTWEPSRDQAPGTVLSVAPAGQVPVTATVFVTGASKPAAHEQGHDHGHSGGHDGGGHSHGGGQRGGGDNQGGD